MIQPRQITSSKPSWCGDEYASRWSWNSDNSRLLLVHVDHFALHDGSGAFLQDLKIPASAEPWWSTKDPKTFYFISENALMRWTDGAVVTVHVFKEYPPTTPDGRNGITGGGSSKICSADSDHLALANGAKTEVFVYQISKDRKGPVFPTDGFDWLMMTADRKILLSVEEGEKKGVWLLYAGQAARRIAPSNGHSDVCSDINLNGDPCLIWHNSASNPVDPPGCDNGIVKVNLVTGVATCLLKLPWSMAVDISACDKGFCLVSTYGVPVLAGAPYQNQILKVALDGSGAEVLCDHGSRPTGVEGHDYNWQPKASLSMDGSRFVYCSNMGDTKTLDYCDVWLGVIPVVDSKPTTPLPGWTEVLSNTDYRLFKKS